MSNGETPKTPQASDSEKQLSLADAGAIMRAIVADMTRVKEAGGAVTPLLLAHAIVDNTSAVPLDPTIVEKVLKEHTTRDALEDALKRDWNYSARNLAEYRAVAQAYLKMLGQ